MGVGVSKGILLAEPEDIVLRNVDRILLAHFIFKNRVSPVFLAG